MIAVTLDRMTDHVALDERQPRRGRATRWIGLSALALVILLLACAAWLGVRGAMARADLLEARAELALAAEEVRSGNAEAALQRLPSLAADTAAARSRTSDPLWRAAEWLPVIGDDLTAVRVVADSVDTVVREVVTPLLSQPQVLDTSLLRRPDGGIDLDALRSLLPVMTSAVGSLDVVRDRLAALPSEDLLPQVAAPTAELQQQVEELSGQVTPVAGVAEALLPALGADGPRRYLLAFQNSAEARGTGGLIGAFSVLELDDGAVALPRIGINEEIEPRESPAVDLGPEFTELWGNYAALSQNVNLSPHFPYAAQLLRGTWEQQEGQPIDGVIALDPVALSYLLQATGPVTLSSGEQVGPENAAQVLMETAYARFDGDTEGRDQFLREVTDSVFQRLLAGDVDTVELARQVGRTARDGRLQMWSVHAEEQRLLVEHDLAGALPPADSGALGVVVNDAAGSKLAYYLDRDLTYSPGCPGGGELSTDRRASSLTMSLTNAAPASVPAYAGNNIRGFDGPNGTIRVLVSAYVPDAGLRGITVDGVPAEVSVGSELGYRVLTTAVDVAPGATTTVRWELNEPADGPPRTLMDQPLVLPMSRSVRTTADSPCLGDAG